MCTGRVFCCEAWLDRQDVIAIGALVAHEDAVRGAILLTSDHADDVFADRQNIAAFGDVLNQQLAHHLISKRVA